MENKLYSGFQNPVYKGERSYFKFFSLLATVTINYLKPKLQQQIILKLLE